MKPLLVLDEALRYFQEGAAERAFAAKKAYEKTRPAGAVVDGVMSALSESVRFESRPRRAAAIVELLRDGCKELAAGRFLEAKKLAGAAESLRRAALREQLEAPGVPAALAEKAVTDFLSEAAEALQKAADLEAEKP